MSRDDKINKIESFLQIILLHPIKQQAEQRTTRSWEVSIRNAVDGVQRVNKRRKGGGWLHRVGKRAGWGEERTPTRNRHAKPSGIRWNRTRRIFGITDILPGAAI